MISLLKKGHVVSIVSCLITAFAVHKWCDDFSYSTSSSSSRSPEFPPSPYDFVDADVVDANHPRPFFSYTMQPWNVVSKLSRGSLSNCKAAYSKNVVTFLIVVKSAVGYTDKREAVRATWGSVSYYEGVQVIVAFIVGETDFEFEQRTLQNENNEHGDIIRFKGSDGYRNIALKVLAGMQWAVEHLPYRSIYASADDDFMVEIGGVCDKLKSLLSGAHSLDTWMDSAPIYCVYKFASGPSGPIRARYTKYYTSPEEYRNWNWPKYCYGGWYLTSQPHLARLYEASKTKLALRMDDVWVTGVVRMAVPVAYNGITQFRRESGEAPFVQHLADGQFQRINSSTEVLRQKWDVYSEEIKGKSYCLN